MKKRILLLSVLLLVLCVSLCLVACSQSANKVNGGGLWVGKPSGDTPANPNPDIGGDEPSTIDLTTPLGLSVDDTGLASWTRVNGAEGYDVKVNSYLIEGRKLTSLSLVDLDVRPENGVFVIQVRAVRGDEKSDWCESVTYTHIGAQMVYPVLSYSAGSVVWTANSQAKSVEITVNGESKLLPSNTASFDLSALNEDASISVKLVGDGVYVLDSKSVTVEYNHKTGKISLPSPENVKMEIIDGCLTLTFDEVLGANVYYLQDVNNTVTQIKENTSDRTNKFLIKAVWAGNTDLNVENSSQSDVVYFSSEQGLGTETNPYVISNAEEMRFIEYYESLNLAKYYKFACDIVLDEYNPRDDEDVSNFYTLGSLSGVIDGDGHSLLNLVVYFKDGYSSIFDSISASGVIKNLVIENAKWRTWTNRTNDGVFHEKGGECAILAYSNRGTIDNVIVKTCSITAVKDGAAGLVTINKGTIKNCIIESTTSIYGANEAGGIAIFNSGKIERCVNKASVSGNKVIGGIVGRNNGIVTECANEGVITASTYGGGIVGYNYNIYDEFLQFPSTISYCYNIGDVNVISYGGGIVGKNGGNGLNEVGTLSYANAAVLSCYNAGRIKGSNSLGGIVGDNYGFHENADDLGVVNCYNSGLFDVDAEALASNRVYLSIANCSWGSSDGALFYLHYWSNSESSQWPGIKMMETVILGETYYYADISIPAEQLNGIIFNRINPSNGEIWNQTDNIEQNFVSGKLCFKVNNTWTSATSSSSQTLIEKAPLSVGGISGYNNMINDCYFVAQTIAGKSLEAGIVGGTQQNKVFINGKETTSNKCIINDMDELLNILNEVNDVWVSGDDGPVLKWQKQ